MGYLIELIHQHMVMVFFIYGAAFFLFGSVVIIQSDVTSKFMVGRYFWLLGVFGILHGFNEWLDMLLLYKGSSWTPDVLIIARFLRNIFSFSSFVFLLQYGFLSFILNRKIFRWFAHIVLWFSVIFVSIIILMPLFKDISTFRLEFLKTGGILIRYFIGFPGAFLTGVSFLMWQKKDEIRKIKSTWVNISFVVVGFTFILYAILTGLIVPAADFFPASIINYKLFDHYLLFPVQFYRTLCALVLLIFMFGVLRIFNIEKYKKIST